MEREPVDVSICSNEEASWDTIWKWDWFLKTTWKLNFRKEIEDLRRALYSILPEFQVNSILDCSCGLGLKTIILAEMGYEVEGSDSSPIAIRYAPQLAKEEGLNIRFFHSRYEDLGSICERKFDCIYSDAFDWIRTRETLKASAKGVHSVLNEDGIFVLHGVLPEWSKSDLRKLIEEEWKKHERFEILPPYEKSGTKLTMLTVYDKTLEGVLENRIYIIEEHREMRAEITFMMNLIKWTWRDYTEVLKEAGFREVNYIKKEGIIFNIGIK